MGLWVTSNEQCLFILNTHFFLFLGIHQHVILAAGFVTALTLLNKKRDAYFAEKDAVYKHYIELHPEEFEEQGNSNTY